MLTTSYSLHHRKAAECLPQLLCNLKQRNRTYLICSHFMQKYNYRLRNYINCSLIFFNCSFYHRFCILYNGLSEHSIIKTFLLMYTLSALFILCSHHSSCVGEGIVGRAVLLPIRLSSTALCRRITGTKPYFS